ncbi:helix-turn-helix domain-containing protein, partial [Paenochrobactrum glaciei]|uniref:helix-turn-helix domain-containing protein n=1 Tax=Paenochrobactrum glaciei TaxID=486407 RepID=UPI0035BC79BC
KNRPLKANSITQDSPKKWRSVGAQVSPEDKVRNAAILKMLESGQSWNSIIQATGCSRSTLSRIKNQIL